MGSAEAGSEYLPDELNTFVGVQSNSKNGDLRQQDTTRAHWLEPEQTCAPNCANPHQAPRPGISATATRQWWLKSTKAKEDGPGLHLSFDPRYFRCEGFNSKTRLDPRIWLRSAKCPRNAATTNKLSG